jgi:hypothetical protein
MLVGFLEMKGNRIVKPNADSLLGQFFPHLVPVGDPYDKEMVDMLSPTGFNGQDDSIIVLEPFPVPLGRLSSPFIPLIQPF